MKITVVGLGYVGLSNAIILAQNNQVVALDVDLDRVDLVNARKATVEDADADRMFASGNLNLRATTDVEDAFSSPDFVLIATPTSYDLETNQFDTSSVVSVINQIKAHAPQATIVIKSTIPVGFVEQIGEKHGLEIFFSPEFLREGQAVHDNLNPSRIIIGSHSAQARAFADLMVEAADAHDLSLIHI